MRSDERGQGSAQWKYPWFSSPLDLMAAHCTVVAKSVKVPLEICCIIQLQALSVCVCHSFFPLACSSIILSSLKSSLSLSSSLSFSRSNSFLLLVSSLFLSSFSPTHSCPFSSETLIHSLSVSLYFVFLIPRSPLLAVSVGLKE